MAADDENGDEAGDDDDVDDEGSIDENLDAAPAALRQRHVAHVGLPFRRDPRPTRE